VKIQKEPNGSLCVGILSEWLVSRLSQKLANAPIFLCVASFLRWQAGVLEDSWHYQIDRLDRIEAGVLTYKGAA